MRLPRKLIGFFIVIILLGAAGAGIWWRIRGASAAENEAAGNTAGAPAGGVSADSAFSTDLPIPVEGAQVIRGDLVLEVRASGQAVAWQGASIRAQVAGQLRGVPVRENTPVGPGALLARIDSTELQLAVDEAQARLDQAQATFREQTIGDDRITDPAVREERQRAARIKAGLDGAEVALKRARLNLDRTQVTAPFGGRVASVKVVTGQHVSAGEELMQILDIDPIKIEVQVLESEIGHLQVGREARMTFAAFPGEEFTGRIETINPLVDNVTRQAKVSVTLANRGGRVLPGMYANVILAARRFPDRILVPVSAVLERDVDRRTMLFVFDGNGTEGMAEWRYVTTGLRNSQYFEIVENPDTKMVQPGEIVLVGGHMMLTHAARVQLTENPAAVQGGRPR